MKHLYMLILANGSKALAEASDEFVRKHRLFYNGIPVSRALLIKSTD